jgi:lysophospholipase L1-like esterase
LRTLRTKAWLHKWELVAVVVLVGVAGEIYLRLPIGRQIEYQPDEELVSILAPGQQSLHETVNRDGHRGKDTDWSAPVILAVGDSQGWGAGVADDEVWTTRLEQRLKRQGAYAAFQVVNASHPGFGPFQHYARARRVLEKHRVDLLLVRVSIEDLNFRPTPAKQVPELFAAAQSRQALKQYTKFVPFLNKRVEEQLVSVRAIFRPRPGKPSAARSPDKGHRMWEEQGRWWEKIADLAEQHGVPLVFFVYDPTDLPGSDVLQAQLQQIIATRENVSLFRLSSKAFGLRGSTPEAIEREFRARFTLPHDPHANALQHDRIGHAVHAFLVEKGLLAEARAKRWIPYAQRF